jgi:hypothetical protein
MNKPASHVTRELGFTSPASGVKGSQPNLLLTSKCFAVVKIL